MSSLKNMFSTYEKISITMIKKKTVKIKMFMNFNNDFFEKQYDKKTNIKIKIKIFKLNVNNYWTWMTIIKMNFNDKIFWKIINNDVKQFSLNKSIHKWLWKQNNSKIKTYILINIEKKTNATCYQICDNQKTMK